MMNQGHKAVDKKLQKKIEELKSLEDQLYLKENLPHLFGHKMYQWQYDFFHSKNKNAFISAGNQLGKTEIQGRKLINLATCVDTWDQWFTTKPDCFWYLLPSKEMVEAIIDLKWKPGLLPKGIFKDHAKYGWEFKKAHGSYSYLHFNNGLRIYFKSYSMGAEVLQSGTCDYIAFDEELPWELYSELNMRRTARNGYLSGVMTPTIGQEEWRKTFEGVDSNELFPNAFKKQVALYDCQRFIDGSPSHWTNERILQVVQSCATDAEIQRRVYGKFVKSEGLVYPQFSIKKNVKPQHPIEFSKGLIYTGVDPGAGKISERSHPCAFTFVWVSADYSKGIVFKHWRSPVGMAIEPRDILKEYTKARGTLVVCREMYDHHDADFQVVANRAGFAFEKADKRRDFGHQMINLLFKSGALYIFDIEEMTPLIQELTTLDLNTAKTSAADDSIDSMRYAITTIPWNWGKITDMEVDFGGEESKKEKIIDMRKLSEQDIDKLQAKDNSELQVEFDFWNSMYNGESN